MKLLTLILLVFTTLGCNGRNKKRIQAPQANDGGRNSGSTLAREVLVNIQLDGPVAKDPLTNVNCDCDTSVTCVVSGRSITVSSVKKETTCSFSLIDSDSKVFESNSRVTIGPSTGTTSVVFSAKETSPAVVSDQTITDTSTTTAPPGGTTPVPATQAIQPLAPPINPALVRTAPVDTVGSGSAYYQDQSVNSPEQLRSSKFTVRLQINQHSRACGTSIQSSCIRDKIKTMQNFPRSIWSQ